MTSSVDTDKRHTEQRSRSGVHHWIFFTEQTKITVKSFWHAADSSQRTLDCCATESLRRLRWEFQLNSVHALGICDYIFTYFWQIDTVSSHYSLLIFYVWKKSKGRGWCWSNRTKQLFSLKPTQRSKVRINKSMSLVCWDQLDWARRVDCWSVNIWDCQYTWNWTLNISMKECLDLHLFDSRKLNFLQQAKAWSMLVIRVSVIRVNRGVHLPNSVWPCRTRYKLGIIWYTQVFSQYVSCITL